MSWRIFEKNNPELAALGFQQLNRKIAYLATLKKDGAPRLHPVGPFIGNGMLFIFTEPSSPKIRDLQRDKRYAMHSAVSRDSPLIEFLVSGKAHIITDPVVREQAENIAVPSIDISRYVLFDFHVIRVLVVEYDQDRQPMVRRWRADKS